MPLSVRVYTQAGLSTCGVPVRNEVALMKCLAECSGGFIIIIIIIIINTLPQPEWPHLVPGRHPAVHAAFLAPT